MAGTSFLAGELVTLMRHAREKRAKEARDLKGEKFKTNMAARGFFRSTHLLSYFVRNFPTRVYLMYSTATAYAGDRNENKEDDSRRHKVCFAWKRKIQSIRSLATAIEYAHLDRLKYDFSCWSNFRVQYLTSCHLELPLS